MKLYEFIEMLEADTHIQITAMGTNSQACIFDGAILECPYFKGRTISEVVTNAEMESAGVTDGILSISIHSEEISKVI